MLRKNVIQAPNIIKRYHNGEVYLATHKFTLNRLTRIFIGFRAQISCSHFYYPKATTF